MLGAGAMMTDDSSQSGTELPSPQSDVTIVPLLLLCHELNTEYNQQDATFHNLFISVRHCICFRRFFRPSSGAKTAHTLSPSLQWHYSPGWASASFKSFLHPSWFSVTTVQFLHPSFAASSFTSSSQHNLGLPLGRFPPGSLRMTLLDKSSSSWRMTCPAHLKSAQFAEFHNAILTTQLIDFLVRSNSPSSPINHWAINSPKDFTLRNTKTMFILLR